MEKSKTYRFYGADTAAVTPINAFYAAVGDQRDLYALLSEIWSRETCAPRYQSEWSEENKTLGQCSITSFLVEDIFGGEVYGVPLPGGGYHCYNVVNGVRFDLTSEQFGGKKLVYDDKHPQSRADHFADKEKFDRYLLLKKNLDETLYKAKKAAAKERREVVAALVRKGDRFMIRRRPEGKARAGLWEFVGGKAETGETLEEALVRECREEIGVSIKVGAVYMTVTHDYPDISIRLTLFEATIDEGEPTPLEGGEIAWITPSEIPNHTFCPADEPIVKRLADGQ